jgi:hypothetical protein
VISIREMQVGRLYRRSLGAWRMKSIGQRLNTKRQAFQEATQELNGCFARFEL